MSKRIKDLTIHLDLNAGSFSSDFEFGGQF